MALWHDYHTTTFIGLYEEEPVLWDPNHPKYGHEINSSAAWLRIGNVMGSRYNVEDLKRKMFSLEEMYRTNKRENTIPNNSYNAKYFHQLDFFLGKTSTYVTTANSTPVEKIGDIEDVKVALDQKLKDFTKDLATKDDVKELTQQVVNLQLENNTLKEKVEKIGDIEGVKVALDQKLTDITKDLATKDDVVKELTQQVVNLQLENNTLKQEVEKIGDIEGVKVASDQKLRDITKDLATKDDVKKLTQQVVNLQLENNALREVANGASRQKNAKREKSDPTDELVKLATARLQLPQDDSDKVAAAWAVELRKMDPQQQLFAKKAINDILFEGQMGTLHRD